MVPNPSIFDKIAQLGSGGARLPRWQPSVEECVLWLNEQGLTRTVHSFQSDPSRDPAMLLGPSRPVMLGVPIHRAERRHKVDLEELKKHYRGQGQGPRISGGSLDELLRELRDPAGAVRTLDTPSTFPPSAR